MAKTIWITECPDPAGWQQRILDRIKIDGNGCWIWQRSLTRKGYGHFRAPVQRVPVGTGAHRAAWLAFRGPIPYPLVPDHLCRVRACCNPDHMELVTIPENIRRGDAGPKGCKTHGYTDGYWNRAGGTLIRWVCRPCTNRRNRAYRARKAAARAA